MVAVVVRERGARRRWEGKLRTTRVGASTVDKRVQRFLAQRKGGREDAARLELALGTCVAIGTHKNENNAQLDGWMDGCA